MLQKFVVFSRATKASRSFQKQFDSGAISPALSEEAKRHKASPLARLFQEVFLELDHSLSAPQSPFLKKIPQSQGEHPKIHVDIEKLTKHLERHIMGIVPLETARLERFNIILATTGAITPFIGLFGTVWGIMNAFRGISMMQSASIAAVAPGISEALVATAAGLAAAIPAVIGYNVINSFIRRQTVTMQSFAIKILGKIEVTGLQGSR